MAVEFTRGELFGELAKRVEMKREFVLVWQFTCTNQKKDVRNANKQEPTREV